MTLHFYWTYLETQKGPNYWYEQSFLVWSLLRQRNGGWNSGQKPAIIVTDAFNNFSICSLYHLYIENLVRKLWNDEWQVCIQFNSMIFDVYQPLKITNERSIYGLYIKSAPFIGDLKKIPETKNNSLFYILKLYFFIALQSIFR